MLNVTSKRCRQTVDFVKKTSEKCISLAIVSNKNGSMLIDILSHSPSKSNQRLWVKQQRKCYSHEERRHPSITVEGMTPNPPPTHARGVEKTGRKSPPIYKRSETVDRFVIVARTHTHRCRLIETGKNNNGRFFHSVLDTQKHNNTVGLLV